MKKSFVYNIIILALVSLTIFQCNKSVNSRTEAKSANIRAELAVQTIDSLRNERDQLVTEQAVLVIQTRDELAQMKEYTDSIFALKNKAEKRVKDVIAFYSSKTTTSIKDRLVPYIDSAARKRWGDSLELACKQVIDYYKDSSVIVPIRAIDSTKEYKADFSVTTKGVTINELSVVDTQYIRFVTIKGGLFKKDAAGKRHIIARKSVQVQVLHTNSLIKVNGMNSVIYSPRGSPKVKAFITGAALATIATLLFTQ